MSLIIGNGLVLRPYREDDAHAIHQATTNPVLRRLTGTQNNFTLEQIQQYIVRSIDVTPQTGFIIALPDGLNPLGEVVINNISSEDRSANIRISLFQESLLGNGYGTEAMRLMVDYGFKILNLHRISLEVFAFNARALRVYEKVGFKQEGVLRDALFYDGEFHDAIIMSILEDEWSTF